jgi:hypothetical protein
MAYLFTIIFLIALILLVIGLAKPTAAFFWRKGPVRRRHVVLIYGGVILISAFIVGTIAPEVPAGKQKTSDEEPAESPAKVQLSEKDLQRELNKSCDTTFRQFDTSYVMDHDTGYIVAYHETPFEGPVQDPIGKPWVRPTYKQTGPSVFDADGDKTIPMSTAVRIVDGQIKPWSKYIHGYLRVVPLGTSDTVWIEGDDFTPKDIRACTVLQKAKNGFYTRAEYIASPDATKRPMDQEDRWVKIQPKDVIIVTGYEESAHKIITLVYQPDGTRDAVFFDAETLKEIK